ncbi:metalloproteinase inhibitor 3-like [Mytilus edulis]|uniref:metalloproteinase inhibitor 3-like n=1 Tax=Mytilus edulis TaxID=6550 RepID=UPI0039EF3787
MNRLMLLVNTVLLVTTWTANDAHGCSCFPQHPQSHFCSADFVFYGKVLKEQVKKGPPGDVYDNETVRKYTMQVLHKIKGLYTSVDRDVVVQSPGNSALCGMTLQVGQQYVIMGHRDGRKKMIRSCDFVKRTSSLSFEQMFYIFTTGPYSYLKNCKNGCNDISDSSRGCHFSHDNYFAIDCLSLSALCRKEKNVCKWYNDEHCPSITFLPNNPTTTTATSHT